MVRSRLPLAIALGFFCSAVPVRLSAQDPMTAQEKIDTADVNALVNELVLALNRADLNAMKKLYGEKSSAEITKKNLDFLGRIIKETKNLKVELKSQSTNVVSTNGTVTGFMRLSGEDKATGRAYFPDDPIPFYIGLDKSIGDSPWHVRVFMIHVDEAVIERRIRAFYDAFVKKDEKKVMETWTTRLTKNAVDEKRDTARLMFSKAGPIKLVSVEIEEIDVDGDKATVRVKVELTADEAKTGEKYLAGPMDLDWQMLREGSDWKAIGFALHKDDAEAN